MAAPTTKVTCPECKQGNLSLTILGKFRPHGPKDDPCPMSGLMIPGGLQLPPEGPESCPSESTSPTTNPNSNAAQGSATRATDTNDSESDTTQETSTSPTTSGPSSPSNTGGGKRDATASPEPATAELPGVDDYTEDLAAAQLRAYQAQAQLYVRPDKLNPAVTSPKQMSEFDLQLTAALKEMFYQYTNRSRRSTQKTLGPSEIGTPCDRRLLMRLMGMPKVNPGRDNWASFVGTCIHTGLEQMFQWADAGQGRFATELKLEYNNPLVPRGTLDLLDRVLLMVDDHKAMGQWSLDQLRTKGIPIHYRVQLHVYGMGARMRGEQVERVGLIGWPREKSNLDNLLVVSEPYDPAIAREAFARVDSLQAQINQSPDHLELAKQASIADDCSFCPYHQKDAKDLTHGGCNGRM